MWPFSKKMHVTVELGNPRPPQLYYKQKPYRNDGRFKAHYITDNCRVVLFLNYDEVVLLDYMHVFRIPLHQDIPFTKFCEALTQHVFYMLSRGLDVHVDDEIIHVIMNLNWEHKQLKNREAEGEK